MGVAEVDMVEVDMVEVEEDMGEQLEGAQHQL